MGAIHLNELLVVGYDPSGQALLSPERREIFKARAKEFGLSQYINSNTGEICIPIDQEQKVIELALLKQAKKLNKFALRTTKKRVENAIIFLELFVVFADNASSEIVDLRKSSVFPEAEELPEMGLFQKAVRAGIEDAYLEKRQLSKLDHKVLNILVNLEQIREELPLTKSGTQPILKSTGRKIDKLISECSLAERKVYAKHVKKALKILKEYSS